MRTVSDQVFNDIADIIGEGVHTGLRKFSDAPSSATAWNAIHELPHEDWSGIVQMVAAQVLRVMAEDKLVKLTAADKRFLHKADGC